MGDKVKIDEKSPDKQAINVSFPSTSNVTDLVHLKGLTELRTLELNDTNLTDKGLEHLKELPKLSMLYLNDTKVTVESLLLSKILVNLVSQQSRMNRLSIMESSLCRAHSFV